MMKIAFISYLFWPPDFGGELLATQERLRDLAHRGHTVSVLTSRSLSYSETACQSGLLVQRPWLIPLLSQKLVYILWVLFKLITIRYDVVHLGAMPFLPFLRSRSSYLISTMFARVARFREAIIIIVHSLANEQKIFDAQLPFKRRLFNQVHKIVSVSPALHDAVAQEYPTKAILIPCGVNEQIFEVPDDEIKKQVRRELGIQSDETVFSFLGRVTFRKGFDVLANAFANLSSQYPNWRLLVIGPCSQSKSQNLRIDSFDEITQKISENPKVIFCGQVNDRTRLANYLSISDVFIFPSRREGMGIAPLEAMALEIPVIVARIAGVTDLANIHGQTGLFVEPGNCPELETAMKLLGNNTELRRQMGTQARARVLEECGWEKHIHSWETLYATGDFQVDKKTLP